MIPSSWTEYRRDGDGELLGYLRPVAGRSARFVPVTVFGYPLQDEPLERDDAERVLEATGLSYLADRWLLHRAGVDPVAVQIVEASPARLVVQNVDFGSGYDIGKRFVLPVPEEGCLRRG